MPFERSANTEGDYRHARRVAKTDDRSDLFIRRREYHDIGQRGVGEALAMAVAFANGARGHRAIAVIGREPRDEVREVAGIRARGMDVGVWHGVIRISEYPDAEDCPDGRASCRTRRSGAAWARPCRG